eukprot:g1496.t1
MADAGSPSSSDGRPQLLQLQRLQLEDTQPGEQEMTPRTKSKMGILKAMLPGTVALLFSSDGDTEARDLPADPPAPAKHECAKQPKRRQHPQTRRRAMVQAARQRKAEISELEQQYLKEHGRLPLTPTEKDQAGVRELYVQYRKMKRFIRDDAACAIQRCARRRLLGTEDQATVPLAGLKREKRELKAKLKAYDNEFLMNNGRLPNKSEKEPIRNLYERYNEVKKAIVSRSVQAKENRGAVGGRGAKLFHQ